MFRLLSSSRAISRYASALLLLVTLRAAPLAKLVLGDLLAALLDDRRHAFL
jgi:hypothetical protein